MREMEWEQLRAYLETTTLSAEEIVKAVSEYQRPKEAGKKVEFPLAEFPEDQF